MTQAKTYTLKVQFDADQTGNSPLWDLVDNQGNNALQKKGPDTGDLLLAPGSQLSIVLTATAEKGTQTTGATLGNVALITLPCGNTVVPSLVATSPYSVLQLPGSSFTVTRPQSQGWQNVFTLSSPLPVVGSSSGGDQGTWELALIVNVSIQGQGPNARPRVLRFDPEVKVGDQR